jgi:hypothetical protein
MINGTAIGFVQKYPQVNVLKTLSEIAEGKRLFCGVSFYPT